MGGGALLAITGHPEEIAAGVQRHQERHVRSPQLDERVMQADSRSKQEEKKHADRHQNPNSDLGPKPQRKWSEGAEINRGLTIPRN